MKRLLALLLCAFVLLSASGCGKEKTKNDNANVQQSIYVGDGISLACNTADSFNPYKSKTSLNRLISSLLYDSLVMVDGEYNPVNVLASNVEVNKETCIVTIKNVTFTDGSFVTAEDVVYSFNLAKASSAYSAGLASITSAVAESGKTVIFTSSKIDPLLSCLLTFPIIKKGSDLLKNEDNVELPPIGSGRYKLDSNLKGLTANQNYHLTPPAVKNVRLINTPDEEALSHAIEIGAVDMYYTDLSDCNILRMSGKRVNVTLNNLVYVGVNLNNEVLKNANMRHGISAAINREKICEDAFFTNAVPATGVYNPAWQPVKGIQTIQTTSKIEISIENFEKIGYNRSNNEGFFVNANGTVIELRLLVNQENAFRSNAAQLIVSQLAAAGIKVKIESVPYNQYVARLKAGQFDLYLAEVNINNNMDLTELLCSGGKVAYGIKNTASQNKEDETTEEQPVIETVGLEQVLKGLYQGKNTVSDVASMAVSELPIIPICYRTGILFCGNEIPNPEVFSSMDIYSVLNTLILK